MISILIIKVHVFLILTGCDDVEVSGATDEGLNGKYYVHYARRYTMCHDKMMYGHHAGHYYLYYTGYWWVVSDTPCDTDTVDPGVIRTKAIPLYRRPMEERWQERSHDEWAERVVINAVCHIHM
jgi:hypothetical protein